MGTAISTFHPAAARRPSRASSGLVARLRSAVQTLRPPVAQASRPVLLLQGFASSPTMAGDFARALEAALGRAVVRVEMPASVEDLVAAAEVAHQALLRLAARPGFEFADVVGHGSGGLVATYLLKRLDRGQHVRCVATLGTPHRGARFSRTNGAALPGASRALEQSHPDSPLVQELKWLPTPGGCRVVSIAGSEDRLVPEASAELTALPGHRNQTVPGASHLGLVFSKDALRLLGQSLGRATVGASAHGSAG